MDFTIKDLETDPQSLRGESNLKKHKKPVKPVDGDGAGVYKHKPDYKVVDVGDDLIAQVEEETEIFKRASRNMSDIEKQELRKRMGEVLARHRKLFQFEPESKPAQAKLI